MPFLINCRKYFQDFLVSLKLTGRTNYTNPPPLATFLLSPFGRKNNVGKYLVELFWRPDLQFGIEFSDTNGTVEGDPEGGNKRRRQRLRRLSRQEDRWVRAVVVVVVVSSVALIAIGAVVYLLNKRFSGDPERAAEASEPDTAVTHSEQFQEELRISNSYVAAWSSRQFGNKVQRMVR